MRPNWNRRIAAALMAGGIAAAPLSAQQKAPASLAAPANLTLPAASSPLPAETLLDPTSRAWDRMTVRRVALNRTPPLYDSDPPAALEITVVEVRLARASGRLLVHLAWRDPTENSAELAGAPAAPPEQRNLKEHTAATERFFDAAAVMHPARAPDRANPVSPSLQMGDPGEPVTIYYWNAARGAILMEAQGRGTTRRTGQTFPARSVYQAGGWRVVLQLPELRPGLPLAFAVWNGSQLDRDGRKYFSVWHWLE